MTGTTQFGACFAFTPLKMYMRFLSLLLLSIIIQQKGFAQQNSNSILYWNKDKKLSWSDYLATPDDESDAAASTTTQLNVEYEFTKDKFSFRIKSFFLKSSSWGRHKTEYILSHEQGHFDIAEIFARKLHKALREYVFNKKTFQTDLKHIYDGIVAAKTAMQDEYDRETNHSINKEKQNEWLIKIAELLQTFEPWVSY